MNGMSGSTEKFGAFVRQQREAKELGLRQMAKMIGVSPTYLSKVERDEFSPPAEDKVASIAEIIGCDPDELLALAGRIPSDVAEIIKSRPTWSSVVRMAENVLSKYREPTELLAYRSPDNRLLFISLQDSKGKAIPIPGDWTRLLSIDDGKAARRSARPKRKTRQHASKSGD